MAQMQTVSIRLPDDDFQWLLSLQEGSAKTPSEKLRALLQRVRQQEAGLHDPERCSAWMRDLVQPLADALSGIERRQQRHSDVLTAVVDHVPQVMAALVSARLSAESSEQEGAEVEALIAQRCFRLFGAILRGAVTSSPASFAPDTYTRHLPDIMELAQIISSRKGKETNHG